jgi:DNA-binding NarL/FixJ family response regulator
MSIRQGTFGRDEGFRRLAERLRAVSEVQRVRVLVADDHRLFAESLTVMLEMGDEIEVVGIAGDGREAAALSALLCPDAVVMDLDMPVMDGIEATSLLRRSSPRTAVVILTASRDPEDEQRAREAGAVAFLHKDTSIDTLCDTVCDVARPVVPLRRPVAALQRTA